MGGICDRNTDVKSAAGPVAVSSPAKPIPFLNFPAVIPKLSPNHKTESQADSARWSSRQTEQYLRSLTHRQYYACVVNRSQRPPRTPSHLRWRPQVQVAVDPTDDAGEEEDEN